MLRICKIFFLLLGLTTISFKPIDTLQFDNLSAFVVKLKYNSPLMSGFGGSLKIRNTETGELFESHSNRGLNTFVVIEDIPAGTYSVEEIKIISGGGALAIRDESKFNLIKIDSPRVYYLGSYMTKKIPPMMGLHFRVTRAEDEDIEKIYKQLKKRSAKWLQRKVDFERQLFLVDNTDIDLGK